MFTGRRFGRTRVTSSPCRTMRPASGTSKPAIIRRLVVLPQPLGPSSEKNSPSAIESDTSCTAATRPNPLLTPSSAIATLRSCAIKRVYGRQPLSMLTSAPVPARNRHVRRAVQAATALAAVMRNPELRKVELAWGASIVAEWAHFVALSVFAYAAGGASAVGVAGLVRLLPSAVCAPLASSLGDRFRRERFLLGIAAAGCAALAG